VITLSAKIVQQGSSKGIHVLTLHTQCVYHNAVFKRFADAREGPSLSYGRNCPYIVTMFADLLKRLTAPEPAQVPDSDARLALGALLVRLARADGDYSTAEADQIDLIMAKRYGLSPFETAKLRGECEALEREAPDTVRFTRAIKDAVAYEDRMAVISAMWEIVLADGERDAQENSLMRMVAPMLGITDQESNAARRAVDPNS